MEIGKEGLKFENGAFTYYGVSALTAPSSGKLQCLLEPEAGLASGQSSPTLWWLWGLSSGQDSGLPSSKLTPPTRWPTLGPVGFSPVWSMWREGQHFFRADHCCLLPSLQNLPQEEVCLLPFPEFLGTVPLWGDLWGGPQRMGSDAH